MYRVWGGPGSSPDVLSPWSAAIGSTGSYATPTAGLNRRPATPWLGRFKTNKRLRFITEVFFSYIKPMISTIITLFLTGVFLVGAFNYYEQYGMTTRTAIQFLVVLLYPYIFFILKAKKKEQEQSREDVETFIDCQEENENESDGVDVNNAFVRAIRDICDLDERDYTLMKKPSIPTENGFVEIDYLLLHKSGFYIFGSSDESSEIDERTNALRFFLKVNYTRRELNVDEVPIYSIVVPGDESALKEKLAPLLNANEAFFDEKQMKDLYWKLVIASDIADEIR